MDNNAKKEQAKLLALSTDHFGCSSLHEWGRT